MIKKLFLLSTVIITSLTFSAKKINVEFSTYNCLADFYSNENIKGDVGSDDINDGVIKVKVTRGVTPYKYYWSDKNTDINSSYSHSLTEGVSHHLVVVDNNKDTLFDEDIFLEAKSTQEKINASLPNQRNNNIHYAYMDCSNNCQGRPSVCGPKKVKPITGQNVNANIWTTS